MRFVLITQDQEVIKATNGAFQPDDELLIFSDWQVALDACDDVDLLFVDMIATLKSPHKVAGYEKFAEAKMAHEIASSVPLILIAPPEDYAMDFMVGWPNFVFAHLRRPLTFKLFRRATTWV